MPVTIADLAAMKARRERFVMLTAYDALTARVLDEAGIPLLLVGDSLGMVVLGHGSTLPVTLGPGGAWRRLYSAPSTSRTTFSASSRSKPWATSSSTLKSSST